MKPNDGETTPAPVPVWKGFVTQPELAQEVQVQNRENRIDFLKSDTFMKMRDAIVFCDGMIDSEKFAYYPLEAKEGAGWVGFSDSDVQMMFSVCEPELEGGVCEDLEWDEGSPFAAATFFVHGIFVSWMTGQGTYITLYGSRNKAMEAMNA